MAAATDKDSIYAPRSAMELARMFELPIATVRDNLSKVIPVGKRANVDLFLVKDAAPWLLPTDDSELVSRILRLNHNALPKMLAKEYWAGQTSKQKYEITAGDLWPTAKVVEYLATTFKNIRLSLLLLTDSVDREQELTEKQREIIVRSVDQTLNEAADRLVKAFADGASDQSRYPLDETVSSGKNDRDEEL